MSKTVDSKIADIAHQEDLTPGDILDRIKWVAEEIDEISIVVQYKNGAIEVLGNEKEISTWIFHGNIMTTWGLDLYREEDELNYEYEEE